MTASVQIIQHRWDVGCYLNLPSLVDMVFADPPYNYGVRYDGGPSDSFHPTDYQLWVSDVMIQLAGMVRSGGTLWWLCPAEQGWWVWKRLRDLGTLLWDRPIIWQERFSQYQEHRLTADYRLLFPVVIGDRSRLTFCPDMIREPSERQRRKDKRANPAGRVPGHVWLTRRLQGTSHDRVPWHPAQLPPEPLERILRGWTGIGDLVLDAFAGSGSMGLACQKLGRRFIGVDASAVYCERMRARLGGNP